MSVRIRRALAAFVVAWALAACGGDTAATPTDSPRASASPQQRTLAKVVDLGERAPPFEGGALGVWTTDERLKVWSKPNDSAAPTRTIETANPAEQTLVFLVMAARRDSEGTGWFKIQIPERPNGSTGWIHSDPMQVLALNDKIEVDLSSYSLKHFKKGKLVNEFTVGIGRDQTPTPTGTFFVWASIRQADPNGPYGSYALGLSGFSPVLSEWPGGGRSAIHGTADPSDRGRRVSFGCVRVFNADMKHLSHVPMGTPVIITR